MQLVLDPDMIACASLAETALTEMDDIDALDRMYRSRLLRFVAYSTGDQDLAETIVQDCLLKAFNSRESFRGDCSAYTWLAHIATNLVRDHQRSRKFQFWRRVQRTAPDLSEFHPHCCPARTALLSRRCWLASGRSRCRPRWNRSP